MILYCLLDRIPIIVMGNEAEIVDSFLIELSDLINIRSDLVFNTDFISKEEYEYLLQNESLDYNIQRIIIRSPCDISFKAFKLFDNFTSWLIGISRKDPSFNKTTIRDLIKKKLKQYLLIHLNLEKIELFQEGISLKSLNLTLEEEILNKISKDTEKSIAGMKRVLLERIYTQDLDDNLMKTLLDFDNEKEEIKKNILKKEIQNFFSACKRAFFILSKLNLLYNMEMNVKISHKTLLKTIDYIQGNSAGSSIAPIERIISFIEKEWGENYSILIENDKKLGLTENIQSLWG
ncbi:MAG: hypothetical protein ACTSWE_09295 [Promethearchaeota archaeon]